MSNLTFFVIFTWALQKAVKNVTGKSTKYNPKKHFIIIGYIDAHKTQLEMNILQWKLCLQADDVESQSMYENKKKL